MNKVQAHHLARKACVYVRQSSLEQVRNNRESGRRQLAFRSRAEALGWAPEQIEIIDEDQGLSGASTEGREGFKRLVMDVGLAKVGVVLGLEASRLSRSCADWHRLLEIAALTKTLIVDEQGVYDPIYPNDRLLLGIKGTISEAELHSIKQRMIGGRRNKARRAELRIRLPAGYVWDEEEGVRQDPDECVRDAVTLFFQTFERLGTALGVTREFKTCHQLFPRRDGWGSPVAALSWGSLTVARAVTILRHPAYAGIYAYARHAPHEMDPEDPCAGGRILVRDSHPGYITEAAYERNVARLESNRSYYRGMQRKGSAREGESLLGGIVLCGVCGRRLNPVYTSRTTPQYVCRDTEMRRICQRVHARHVDPLIEKVVIETISKEELSLAVGAMEKLAERAMAMERQWQKRMEAARYEAERASRRYHLVEPENRLVARTLEREWNDRLLEAERVETEYEKAREKPPITISPEQRELILSLSKDLPRLFRARTTKVSQKKEIVRLLIEDVTLTNQDDPRQIDVAIRWKTGVVSHHTAERPALRPQNTPKDVVRRIGELYRKNSDREVADILNAEGLTSGRGRPFTLVIVRNIRKQEGWRKKAGP